MSALEETPPVAPAARPACEYNKRGPACGSTDGLVRVFWGVVCREHLPGAEVYEVLWASPTPLAGPGLVVADDGTLRAPGAGRAAAGPGPALERPMAAVHQLPDPGRARASAHADAAPGEANAAKLVAYRAGKIRARVLEHLVDVGPRGTTAIEAWQWYCDVHVPGTERYSVAPRLSEMVTDGWAVKTGDTRNVRGAGYPPEEVYRLSPRGRAQLGVTW
jgi:hypothetical protein